MTMIIIADSYKLSFNIIIVSFNIKHRHLPNLHLIGISLIITIGTTNPFKKVQDWFKGEVICSSPPSYQSTYLFASQKYPPTLFIILD